MTLQDLSHDLGTEISDLEDGLDTLEYQSAEWMQQSERIERLQAQDSAVDRALRILSNLRGDLMEYGIRITVTVE